MFEPIRRLPQRTRAQTADAPLRMHASLDQPRALEHVQVARNRRQRDVERLRQVADRRLAPREPGEDRAARRIGERGENDVELASRARLRIGGHGAEDTPRLFNSQVKYTARQRTEGSPQRDQSKPWE